MRNTLSLIAVLTALTLVAGCGDGSIATLKVTGTVTYDGQPLAGANVTFSPKTEGEGLAAYGITDASGRYALQTAQGKVDGGTTAGAYDVMITKYEQSAAGPTDEEREEMERAGTYNSQMNPAPKSLIPERYGRFGASGLTATVEKGQPNVFNFDLKEVEEN